MFGGEGAGGERPVARRFEGAHAAVSLVQAGQPGCRAGKSSQARPIRMARACCFALSLEACRCRG